jgi:XTP/dITP diphosphohydrolase
MLIATHNRGKIAEYEALLKPFAQNLIGLADLGITEQVEETGETFAENALLKARAYALLSGRVTLADDSGLEVDALEGAPGVHSARYAGPDATDQERNQRLLKQLESVPKDKRQARFRCVIAVAWPDGRCALTRGTYEGTIALSPRGSNGFGYDPLFLVPEYGLTMAELPSNLKNRISHRARAAEAMARLLNKCADDTIDLMPPASL